VVYCAWSITIRHNSALISWFRGLRCIRDLLRSGGCLSFICCFLYLIHAIRLFHGLWQGFSVRHDILFFTIRQIRHHARRVKSSGVHRPDLVSAA